MQKYIEAVDNGEEVLVMRKSTPVFRLAKPHFSKRIAALFVDRASLDNLLVGMSKNKQPEKIDWGSDVGAEEIVW